MTDRHFRVLTLALLALLTLAVVLQALPAAAVELNSTVPAPTGPVDVEVIGALDSDCLAARVTRSGHFEVGFDEFEAMPFTNAVRDTGGFWDPAQPNVLTAPVDGDYLIGGNVRWHHHENVHSGVRNLGIRRSADPRTNISENEWVSTEFDGAYGLQEVTTYFPLRAGESVELVPYQWNTGGATVWIEAMDSVSPSFWMVRPGC